MASMPVVDGAGRSTASTRPGARSRATRTVRPATCPPACAWSRPSLLREFAAGGHRLLLSRRPRHVHRPADTRGRRVHPQPAGGHVRGGRLRVDLRLVEDAGERALRAADVRRDRREPLPAAASRCIVGGSGGWQIAENDAFEELGVDCVVDGRSESAETMALFRRAIAGEDLPRHVQISHPRDAAALLVPDRRTTFGVVEMTTGCGRRCKFCVPDLSPQLDFPKDKIMAAVRANVREGNKLISLATEDMFVWGHARGQTPFYIPEPGGAGRSLRGDRGHARRRAGRPQPLHDCARRRGSRCSSRQLTELLLAKSPIHLPAVSTHPAGEDALAAHRAGNRLGADGQAGHARQERAVPDRRVAERRARGPSRDQPEQLVPGDDAARRRAGRDRRGRDGHARPGVRDRAARPVRLPGAVGVHARCTTRGWSSMEGVTRDPAADAAAVAADDEVLEVQPAPGLRSWWAPLAWRAGALASGPRSCADQRPALHVAAPDVRLGRCPRR